MDIWEAIQSGAPDFSLESDGKNAFGDAYTHASDEQLSSCPRHAGSTSPHPTATKTAVL